MPVAGRICIIATIWLMRERLLDLHIDDTGRHFDGQANLSVHDRHGILKGNARRVCPRHDALLLNRGH